MQGSHLRDKNNDGRREGFQRFMKYRGTLPADFNYKNELAEYRAERHDRIN